MPFGTFEADWNSIPDWFARLFQSGFFTKGLFIYDNSIGGASFAPDWANVQYYDVAVGQAFTVSNPTSEAVPGQLVMIHLFQDAIGGWDITFGTAYKFPTAFSNAGHDASTRTMVVFVCDGHGFYWALGANSWALED